MLNKCCLLGCTHRKNRNLILLYSVTKFYSFPCSLVCLLALGLGFQNMQKNLSLRGTQCELEVLFFGHWNSPLAELEGLKAQQEGMVCVSAPPGSFLTPLSPHAVGL